MKIRTGFVSNSSSSSFTCTVCGQTESGMDMSPSDCDMTECIARHVFCDSHKVPFVAEKTDEEGEYESRYEAPIECCPICQYTALEKGEGLKYLLHRCGLSKEQVLAELKEKFPTHAELAAFLKESK